MIPPGPKQARLAEEAGTRLLNQVDERRNPKTRATVDQLITKYFQVLDVDTQTMRGYKSKHENHIKPLIGSEPLTRLIGFWKAKRAKHTFLSATDAVEQMPEIREKFVRTYEVGHADVHEDDIRGGARGRAPLPRVLRLHRPP